MAYRFEKSGTCRGPNWNTGGWPKRQGNMFMFQCSQRCDANKNCTAFDIARRRGDDKYDCHLFGHKQFVQGGAEGVCYVKAQDQKYVTEIINASYGSGTKRVNVTDAVRKRLRNGIITIPAAMNNLGGDPIYGVRKELQIHAKHDDGTEIHLRGFEWKAFRYGTNKKTGPKIGTGAIGDYPMQGNKCVDGAKYIAAYNDQKNKCYEICSGTTTRGGNEIPFKDYRCNYGNETPSERPPNVNMNKIGDVCPCGVGSFCDFAKDRCMETCYSTATRGANSIPRKDTYFCDYGSEKPFGTTIAGISAAPVPKTSQVSRRTAGRYTRTSTAGKGRNEFKGKPFRFPCPRGSYINNISGKAGQFVSSVNFACSDEKQKTMGFKGGIEGDDYAMQCPQGFSSIMGTSNSGIYSIGGKCSNGATFGPFNSDQGGPGRGTPFEIDCPDGAVLSYAFGSAGDYVGTLGFYCQKLK